MNEGKFLVLVFFPNCQQRLTKQTDLLDIISPINEALVYRRRMMTCALNHTDITERSKLLLDNKVNLYRISNTPANKPGNQY